MEKLDYNEDIFCWTYDFALANGEHPVSALLFAINMENEIEAEIEVTDDMIIEEEE